MTGMFLKMLQWNLFFRTPLFKGHLHSARHKIWSQKNDHIIFVFVTSFEGTLLFKGKGHLAYDPETQV